MKNETKKVEKAEVAVKEVKKEEVANTEKKEVIMNIQEVTKLYADMGIKCYNPTIKSAYRIMGPTKKGSSLNINKQAYSIFSTDLDYENVVAAGIKADDLVLEKGTNNDKCRTNLVRCSTSETLKKVLQVYLLNPVNKIEASPAK